MIEENIKHEAQKKRDFTAQQIFTKDEIKTFLLK